MSDQKPVKSLKSWFFLVLILIALVILGLGEAIKKKVPESPFNLSPKSEFNHNANTSSNQQKVVIAGTIFDLETAKSKAERSLGLSFRPKLGPQEGMIFEFNPPEIPSFWMKDMNFALDIIWLDENGQIVGIETNLRPESFPQLFSPSIPISHAIEVKAGIAEALNLRVGDFIHFLNKN